jgi:hypothetical protein
MILCSQSAVCGQYVSSIWGPSWKKWTNDGASPARILAHRALDCGGREEDLTLHPSNLLNLKDWRNIDCVKEKKMKDWQNIVQNYQNLKKKR